MLNGEMTVRELVSTLNEEMLNLYNSFYDGLPYLLPVCKRANEIAGIDRTDKVEFAYAWDVHETKFNDEEEIDISAPRGIRHTEILMLSDYIHKYVITIGQVKYKIKRVLLKTGVAEVEHWVHYNIDCDLPKKYNERKLLVEELGGEVNILDLRLNQLKEIILKRANSDKPFKPNIS